uniref:Uncharacterized protein n=1 Tax=Oncorhynchus kisutch TaxID=8019 RepID=A0A8C7L4G3_ONCKI
MSLRLAPIWITLFQVCGNLASVNNLLEYQFMQALTKNTNGHLPDTWIGGFDADLTTLTGTLVSPNNAGEGEDCLQMNAASEKLWFDVPWVNSLLHLSPPEVNSLHFNTQTKICHSLQLTIT